MVKRKFLVTQGLRLIVLNDPVLGGSFCSPDILVNPSNIGLKGSYNKNYWMFMGRKNVDTAIHVAAGRQLQQHCDQRSEEAVQAGDCVITPSFKLLASHGIKKLAHVVTPRMDALNAVDDGQDALELLGN